MAEESFQERTEKATPRRREKAKEEGRVARSTELNSAVILCLGLTTVYFLGPYLAGEVRGVMSHLFTEAPNMSLNMESIINFMSNNVLNFFLVLGPILVIVAAIAYGVNVLQVGVMFTTKPLEPKFDKLDITYTTNEKTNKIEDIHYNREELEKLKDITTEIRTYIMRM